MCHQALYDYSILPERQKFYVFKTKNVLSNMKFYHFHKNDLRNYRVKDKNRYIHLAREPTETGKKKSSPTQGRITEGTPPNFDAREIMSKVVEEVDQEELLIERQEHHCAFKQSTEEKAKHNQMVREEYLRDYRLIHSGLIEVALSHLLPSRPREEASKHIIDYSPMGGKYADLDDMDLDYLFDAEEPQDEGPTGDHTMNNNTLNTARPSTFNETHDGKSTMENKKKDLQFLDHIYPHGSSEESVSSEEEEKEITENKVKKVLSPIKRKDSGGGLFGIAEWDSDEEDLPKQKAFSFIDTNLDKFNVLNFIEDQEHKVAHN